MLHFHKYPGESEYSDIWLILIYDSCFYPISDSLALVYFAAIVVKWFYYKIIIFRRDNTLRMLEAGKTEG